MFYIYCVYICYIFRLCYTDRWILEWPSPLGQSFRHFQFSWNPQAQWHPSHSYMYSLLQNIGFHVLFLCKQIFLFLSLPYCFVLSFLNYYCSHDSFKSLSFNPLWPFVKHAKYTRRGDSFGHYGGWLVTHVLWLTFIYIHGWPILSSIDYYRFTDWLSLSISEDEKVVIVIKSDLKGFHPIKSHFFEIFWCFFEISINFSKISTYKLFFVKNFSYVIAQPKP